MDPLTQEQINFAIKCMAEWIRISEDNNRGMPSAADVDHSSLLRRLLSGQPALDSPPPLRFSYPDYNLAEGEEVEIVEIRDIVEELREAYEGAEVCVDQHAQWKWDDRDKQILRYIPTGELYQYQEKERTVATKLGPQTYTAKFLKKFQSSGKSL